MFCSRNGHYSGKVISNPMLKNKAIFRIGTLCLYLPLTALQRLLRMLVFSYWQDIYHLSTQSRKYIHPFPYLPLMRIQVN